MHRLVIAALSALILLCVSISIPQGCGLNSIHWNPLIINLLRVGAPAAAILRQVAPPAHASAGERGAAQSAQESVPLEPGKPIERELSGGQSYSYKITVISGQYLRILVEQRGIDVAVGDRRGVAITLLNIGSVHESLGEMHKALEKLNEALPLWRAAGDRWKVDDRATSELMKRFYQGLLGSEQLRSAEALRQAQLSIWKQKQWREPYYWAAFVLQGEWK